MTNNSIDYQMIIKTKMHKSIQLKISKNNNKQYYKMNKLTKHKNSNHTIKIKSSRNLTIRQPETATSRTPQSNPKKLEIKKPSNIQKFKSIPTIPCRDIQMSSIPTQNIVYQSYTVHPIENILTVQESQPRLLYSVEDRNNHSSSKVSLHSKIRGSSKKTAITSKNKSNYTLQTHRKNDDLQHLYQRTKLVLDSYRARQQQWKKQKCYLLKELEKYKSKNKKRKNSSIISHIKNNKS